MKVKSLLAGITMIIAGHSLASPKSSNVDYTSGSAPLEGYVAYDVDQKGPRPGILIVHDWMGLNSFAKEKADLLARDGYVAFAVDIYGKGIRPQTPEEAAKLSSSFKDDRNLLRDRIRAAFDKLASMPQVDPKKIVVMGYCFGGTTSLELARSGAPLAGTVSFHGGLSNPTPKDAKNIHGKVLVLHGADDPFVPPPEVQAFKDEMKTAGIPFEFVAYPGAVHSFTNPNAASYKNKGAAYNESADRKSWIDFHQFLKRVL